MNCPHPWDLSQHNYPSARMRERVTVVCLSVYKSDFEDSGVFTFETGINVN